LFHIQDFNAYSAECDRFTDHVRAIIAALPDDVEIGRGAVFGQALRQMGHDPASVMV
jgi:hypothetical protein